MLNSGTKDKIYALLSFSAVVLIIGSFALVVNFLLQINKYIFSVNEQIVKEKTTVADKAGFEKIKEKLMLKEGKGAQKDQAEIPREAPTNDVSVPTPLPALSPGADSAAIPTANP